MTAKTDNPVNERALHFLKALVERYIRDGQPVGSRTLAKDTGLELSPATVRNVMSDLEELGLVTSPHTSSGRIPTVSGYRLFLDTLLTVKPLAEAEVDEMRRRFAALDDSASLIATASQLLSGVTRLAGVVMLPRRERNAFRQIEFLPLSGDRVLAILVTDEGEVHNRVIHTDERYSPSQLEQAANYLNALFLGRDMREVRQRLLDEMRRTHDRMDHLMRQALDLARRVVEVAEDRDDLFVAGQTNLMDFAELANLDRLKQLFEA
ncbi:MAG: heat-inducible transcription repressor HrcA, partial [Gammaproteobacteria bacterium]